VAFGLALLRSGLFRRGRFLRIFLFVRALRERTARGDRERAQQRDVTGAEQAGFSCRSSTWNGPVQSPLFLGPGFDVP